MGIVYGFLIVLEMLVSALLITVIFMQKTKGGMGGSAFGGGAGEAIFGSRMGNVLTKATVVLGIVFLVNTLLLTVLTSRRGAGGGSVMESVSVQPAATQQAQPADGGAAGWMEADMPGGSMPIEMPVVPGDAAGDAEVMVIAPAEEAVPDAGAVAPEAAAEIPVVVDAPAVAVPAEVVPAAEVPVVVPNEQ